MKFFISILSIFLFSACSEKNFTPIGTISGPIQIASTGGQIKGNQEVQTTQYIPPQQTSMTEAYIPKKITAIEIIKSVKTVHDLIAVNPAFGGIPNDFPQNQINILRDQYLLEVMMDSIADTEFVKIRKEAGDMYSAKDIWPVDLKVSDKTYTDKLAEQSLTGSMIKDSEINYYRKLKATAESKFYMSPEYRDYILENKTKIEELHTKMKQYWTPEMIELDKDIQKLSNDIYRKSSQIQ